MVDETWNEKTEDAENAFGVVAKSSVKLKNLFTENAIKNRFKKGDIPWNKNKKTGYNKKQADKIKGRKMPEEQKIKISKKLKGKKKPNGFGMGKIHSTETRKKISSSKKGKRTSIRSEFKKGHKLYDNQLKTSSIELIIKKLLDKNNIKYIHQYKLDNIFIPDFFIEETNTIIECDGDYWHSRENSINRDKRKNGYYKKNGFRNIRLNESLIKNKPTLCMEIIKNPNIIFFHKNFEEMDYEWEIEVNTGRLKNE